MRALFLAVASLILTGCKSFHEPGLSYRDARFAEEPVIVQRDGHFYLRYRRALEDGRYPLLALIHGRKTGGAGYYFFSGPISHLEWGNLVERPLAYDEFEAFAREGQVFWLDPDGTKHSIPIEPAVR